MFVLGGCSRSCVNERTMASTPPCEKNRGQRAESPGYPADDVGVASPRTVLADAGGADGGRRVVGGRGVHRPVSAVVRPRAWPPVDPDRELRADDVPQV